MVEWAEVVIAEGLCHVGVPGEWVVEDLLEETCSRGQETGSVQMLDVETKTLPGEWSVISARHPNLKASDLLPSLQVVIAVVVVLVGCVVVVVWIAEDQGDPEASVEAEVWTVEASEDVVWTEGALEEGVVEALQWMTWAEGGEEWDHRAKWI